MYVCMYVCTVRCMYVTSDELSCDSDFVLPLSVGQATLCSCGWRVKTARARPPSVHRPQSTPRAKRGRLEGQPARQKSPVNNQHHKNPRKNIKIYCKVEIHRPGTGPRPTSHNPPYLRAPTISPIAAVSHQTPPCGVHGPARSQYHTLLRRLFTWSTLYSATLTTAALAGQDGGQHEC
jgi:hypothetical protein